MHFLSILLTTSVTAIYNAPIWGNKDNSNANARVRDNPISCKLQQIEVCTYQDEMCSVKLSFARCKTIEEAVTRCKKAN